jgi:hypothetical protein
MKMKPLEQFICDTCGEVINEPKDGCIEWKFNEDGDRSEFLIVHHKTKSLLEGENGCYQHNDGMLPLENFLGARGIVQLTSFLDPGSYFGSDFESPDVLDIREYTELVRRLQIPYYEEARNYWGIAISEGHFDGANEVSLYLPDSLKSLIEEYENRGQ